jgi:hypothetical protein
MRRGNAHQSTSGDAMSEHKHREPRTATDRYATLLHVIDTLRPDIDKKELRDNARIAWPDEAQIMDDVFILHQAKLNASEIFCGAHVVIADGGRRYDSWINLHSANPRHSSHASDKQQKAVSGPCCHTILFGVLNDHSWFQMERNEEDDWVFHLKDFVVYWLTRKNQGPYGSSPYTDSNPIRISTTRRVDGQLVEFD